MDLLQPLIILMGLSGQLLIAKKNPAGYACWIVGNISLMFVYADLHQYGLMGLASHQYRPPDLRSQRLAARISSKQNRAYDATLKRPRATAPEDA